MASCISKLQEFLLKHRKDYINSAGHLVSRSSGMSDSERDQIDSEAEEFIRMCSERIRTLQQNVVTGDGLGEQSVRYRQAVCESLRSYLESVCKLYSEQRAIRVKRIVDRKRISRLQPDGYKKKLLSSAHMRQQNSSGGASNLEDRNTPDSVTEVVSQSDSLTTTATAETTGSLTGTKMAGVVLEEENSAVSDGLTAEERTTFEQENEQLFEQMNSLVDEVRQIEGKVIEISRLQEVFADKVLQQAKELDTVAHVTVEASENVSTGNEQVRQAIKNKASFRLWILLILVVCSFALLFLDWYN